MNHEHLDAIDSGTTEGQRHQTFVNDRAKQDERRARSHALNHQIIVSLLLWVLLLDAIGTFVSFVDETILHHHHRAPIHEPRSKYYEPGGTVDRQPPPT